DAAPMPATDIQEAPGRGMEARFDGRRARLGRADWVAEIAAGGADASGPAFAFEGGPVTGFALSETLRPGAVETIGALQAGGLDIEILSGDGVEPVARMAAALGLSQARPGCSPADKTARLDRLRTEGRHTLMIGDGLNDVAALASAHVSMAPASATEVGRNAADFVFTRGRLDAVVTAHRIALGAARLVRSNFGLAILYNCVAIPLAVAGLVTPLIAALAMSGSSILVVANSLRLNRTPAASKTRAPGAKLSEAAA
ncbi:MAG: HAD-IC family P-type ATPase, partial [Paracoccaceae bacterium]